jgi:SAM-dependent methyltransferase
MRHLRWPLDGFENVARISGTVDTRRRIVYTRYPIGCYRYWFVRAALRDLYKRRGRPLRVLEAGIGDGFMVGFLGGPEKLGGYALPDWIEVWDGVDVWADPKMLDRFSYTSYFNQNLDQPFQFGGRTYDAIVVLHVLEHLYDPEDSTARLAAHLMPAGEVIGGSPTLPHFLAAIHERRLREQAKTKAPDVHLQRHLAAISPRRVRTLAARAGMTPAVVTGAYLSRNSGKAIENSEWWFRANAFWGALVPPLGSEVFFVLQKPA